MSSVPEVTIGELKQRAGEVVRLRGWVQGKRSGGKVVFLLVRDGSGLCQGVVEATAGESFSIAQALTQESSLSITGMVRLDERAPGGAELAVTEVHSFQVAPDYPISRKAHGVDFLMDHRHLWLRSPRQVALMRVRHTVIRAIREFFDNSGFTLVDMPILVPGAGEDRQSLFPVEYFGEKLFLSQTGQLYLESACMAMGKVYCFGPTFRAEKSKTRRHLTEFWMVEPEIAFADVEEVMRVAEDMTCAIVEAVLSTNRAELALVGRDVSDLEAVTRPFPRMTYTEAAALLRSDALRAALESDLDRQRQRRQSLAAALEAEERLLQQSRKGWQQEKSETRMRELREELHELEQDIQSCPEHIRLAQSFQWGKDLGGSDETILARQYPKPLFVTDYPREAKAFYMKVSPDDPRVVKNFDLLAPGGYGEIIGGSQREENPEVIAASMTAKGLRPADYGWYLDLRRYGSVPHGGFGLGVERTVAWLCGLKHVRETIPFPRMMGRVYP